MSSLIYWPRVMFAWYIHCVELFCKRFVYLYECLQRQYSIWVYFSARSKFKGIHPVSCIHVTLRQFVNLGVRYFRGSINRHGNVRGLAGVFIDGSQDSYITSIHISCFGYLSLFAIFTTLTLQIGTNTLWSLQLVLGLLAAGSALAAKDWGVEARRRNEKGCLAEKLWIKQLWYKPVCEKFGTL